MAATDDWDAGYRRRQASKPHAELMGEGMPPGAAMLREAARLLVPGGRIAVTTWEGWGEAPDRYPRDLPTLFRNAGLRVDRYAEQPTWLERQSRIYRQAAAQDRDDPAVTALAEEGRRWQRYRDYVRRIVVAAYRPR